MRKTIQALIAVVTGGVLTFGAGVPAAEATPAGRTPTTGATLVVARTIVNVHSGRCLDGRWQEIAGNGTRVQLWDCYGPRQTNQRWYLVWSAQRGAYQIKNLYNNRCLDARLQGIPHNGTQIQLWDCYGPRQTNQYWRFVRIGSLPGVYQIKSLSNGRCLDGAWEGIAANGTKAQLWDCYGLRQRNQLWRLG